MSLAPYRTKREYKKENRVKGKVRMKETEIRCGKGRVRKKEDEIEDHLINSSSRLVLGLELGPK